MNSKFFATALLLVACGKVGPPLDPSDRKNTEAKPRAVDEIKWIAAGIEDVRDSRAIKAVTYPIGQYSRLLVRYTQLRANSPSVLVQQPILMRIELVNPEQVELARSMTRVCPLAKTWMMYATWHSAHPFGGGAWANPGGDLEESLCQLSLKEDDPNLQGEEEKQFCKDAKTLCFNLGTWYDLYVRQRNIDYGLVLVHPSDPSVLIYGDGSMKGPTVFWRAFR